MIAQYGRGLLAATVALLIGGGPARAGLVITPTFDSSITNDPNADAIEGAIHSAIQVYENTFTNPIDVTIYFQAGGVLGESEKQPSGIPYYDTTHGVSGSFLTALQAQQALQPGDSDLTTALAHLAATVGNPVNGNATVALSTANMKALGMGSQLSSTAGVYVNATNQYYDGVISLNTALTFPSQTNTSANYSLQVVAQHEIDEVLGLGSSLGQSFQNIPWVEDLYRYDGSGARSYTASAGSQAYFSLDGTNLLAPFNNGTNGGDWGDWASSGTARVQDAFTTPGATPSLGVELTALNVIGYTFASQVVPEPSGLAMLGCGMLAVSAIAWRGRKRAAA